MAVIAISSESPELGEAVAEIVCRRLQLRRFTANRCQPTEGMVSPFEFAMARPELRAATPVASAEAGTAIVNAAARGGVVILDNDAAALLADVDHVLRICILADKNGTTRGLTPRGGRDNQFSDDARLFDVIVNADRLSSAQCADIVCAAARSPALQPTAAFGARRADVSPQLQTCVAGQDLACGKPMEPGSAGAPAEAFDEWLKRAEEALYGSRHDGKPGRE